MLDRIMRCLERILLSGFARAGLSVCLIALLVIPVFADEEKHAPEFPLQVEVRTIRADGALKGAAESKPVIELDLHIQDLASQLERLHFSRFNMVDHQSVVLPPRKRRKIELVNGQQIVLRPVAVEGENICLWLKWKDNAGTVLLDTRLRFVAGESMLTGTDHAPDSGVILAIRVEPVR